MSAWVALFRGLNVGGRNRIGMADLRSVVEQAGGRNVESYIQSGNLVFDADDEAAARIGEDAERRVEEDLGVRPRALVLAAAQFRAAAERNPFERYEADPRSLHLYFLDREPEPGKVGALEALAAPDERVSVRGTVLYLAAPSGVGRSRLVAAIEDRLGVRATGRNWATVARLRTMLDERES